MSDTTSCGTISTNDITSRSNFSVANTQPWSWLLRTGWGIMATTDKIFLTSVTAKSRRSFSKFGIFSFNWTVFEVATVGIPVVPEIFLRRLAGGCPYPSMVRIPEILAGPTRYSASSHKRTARKEQMSFPSGQASWIRRHSVWIEPINVTRWLMACPHEFTDMCLPLAVVDLGMQLGSDPWDPSPAAGFYL